MKLKLKLDKKTIQEFLLQNVEKIVLGVSRSHFPVDALLLAEHGRTFRQDARRVAEGRRQRAGRRSRQPRRTPSWR